MVISQIFETTLIGDTQEYSLKTLVVPAFSFKVKQENTYWMEAASKLGLTEIAPVSTWNLSRILASMVVSEDHIQSGYRVSECIDASHGLYNSTADALGFAEEVVSKQLVQFGNPFEIWGSLADLVASATSITRSTGLVTIGSSEKIPLILVADSRGFVVCGATLSLHTALRKGLWERIYDWLQGK